MCTRGEIFGLLGQNGAGKSTTLEIIETLREKTSGKITVKVSTLIPNPKRSKKDNRGSIHKLPASTQISNFSN